MERDPLTYDPVAFLAEFLDMPRAITKATLQAIRDSDTPQSAPSSSVRSLSKEPDDRMAPLTLLDRGVPQWGWEQEYGVPSSLIGVADDLFRHRTRAAKPEVAVIDSAILRLFGPWIRQDAASG